MWPTSRSPEFANANYSKHNRGVTRNPLGDLGETLGDYLREQRQSARLSVRQLSELAGVSNPYLSQIERGLKKPSAEILQQLAKGLQVSAESLYVRAGLLDPHDSTPNRGPDTRAAIRADHRLTSRQKATLLDVYDSFVGVATVAPGAPTTTNQAASIEPVAAPAAEPPSTAKRRPPRTTTQSNHRDQRPDAPVPAKGAHS